MGLSRDLLSAYAEETHMIPPYVLEMEFLVVVGIRGRRLFGVYDCMKCPIVGSIGQD